MFTLHLSHWARRAEEMAMQEFMVIAVGFVILAMSGVDYDDTTPNDCHASLASILSTDCGAHDLP